MQVGRCDDLSKRCGLSELKAVIQLAHLDCKNTTMCNTIGFSLSTSLLYSPISDRRAANFLQHLADLYPGTAATQRAITTTKATAASRVLFSPTTNDCCTLEDRNGDCKESLCAL